ncbi:hypothetical protein ACWGUL_24790 [Streptomyces albidoflavus]
MSTSRLKRTLRIAGTGAALVGALAIGAGPAQAATAVVAWTHGKVHAGPALGERVVSHVNNCASWSRASPWLVRMVRGSSRPM